MALETSEIIAGVVTVVTGLGGFAIGAARWLGGIFSKIQQDNAALTATIQADTIKARSDFAAALEKVEANHSEMHEETLSTLRQIEQECSERAERDHQTIMKLIDEKGQKA